MKKVYWYELCFYGDEDQNAITDIRACSYIIKTEIPPVIKDEVALKILFGENPTAEQKKLIDNCTCVMEVTEDEAQFFDVEGLVNRVESEYGVYYKR
jgi:hypothetical protein